MTIVLFDHPYSTKDWSPLGIQTLGQLRLDQWLGPGKVKFEVAQLEDRKFKFIIWRTYGQWYEDPKRFSDCNDSINSWDENIFLGTDYQTGTVADFSTHTGPYIISNDVNSIFLPEMKAMAKKYHGTRIKSIEVDNNLDHIDVFITY